MDLFGAIVGGGNIKERQRCAEETAKRNVQGASVFFDGYCCQVINNLYKLTSCLQKLISKTTIHNVFLSWLFRAWLSNIVEHPI